MFGSLLIGEISGYKEGQLASSGADHQGSVLWSRGVEGSGGGRIALEMVRGKRERVWVSPKFPATEGLAMPSVQGRCCGAWRHQRTATMGSWSLTSRCIYRRGWEASLKGLVEAALKS